MTRDEFLRLSATIKTAYPREQSLQTKEAMELWFTMLQDLDYKQTMTFLQKWIATEKWIPTIAEIRQGCSEMTVEGASDWGTSWAELKSFIHKYGYERGSEKLDKLSPITREVVRRLGFKEICQSPIENEMSDRSQFRNLYEIISKREQEDRQLPELLKAQIRSYLPGTKENLLAQFAEAEE